MRFSAVLARLAAAIATLSPADANAVRLAWQTAVDALAKARSAPNGDAAVFGFHGFAAGFPTALLPYAGDFLKACSDEADARPRPWASRHLEQAILNFCPVLATPLEDVKTKAATKADKAAAANA